MANLLQRLLDTVPIGETGNPNTERVSVHDFFAFLRAYTLDTTLGLTPAQWRTQASSIFDLSAAQETQLVDFTDGLDGGTDLHLYEAVLMLGQFDKMDGSGVAADEATVRTMLGL